MNANLPDQITPTANSEQATEAPHGRSDARDCAQCARAATGGRLGRKDFTATLVLLVICAAIIGVCLFFRGSLMVLGIGFVTACCFLELTLELAWDLARVWLFKNRCHRCGQR